MKKLLLLLVIAVVETHNSYYKSKAGYDSRNNYYRRSSHDSKYDYGSVGIKSQSVPNSNNSDGYKPKLNYDSYNVKSDKEKIKRELYFTSARKYFV